MVPTSVSARLVRALFIVSPLCLGAPALAATPPDSDDSCGEGWVGGLYSNGGGALLTDALSDGDVLYVFLSPDYVGGLAKTSAARFDGAAWWGLDRGPNSTPRSSVFFDDGSGRALYVGGSFSASGDPATPTPNMARWRDGSWSAVAEIDGEVDVLTTISSARGAQMVAAGNFTHIDGAEFAHIAAWDGSTWTALGDGLPQPVAALAVVDEPGGTSVYAATGDYELDPPIAHVYRWDGTSWTDLTGPVTGEVRALLPWTVDGHSGIVAGGSFQTIADVATSGVATFANGGWSTLGTGLASDVTDLTIHDFGGGPSLFAGGYFTKVDGAVADRVAQWTGGEWLELGGGVDGFVSCLESVAGGTRPGLLVSGYFTKAGGVTFGRMVRWDGSAWSAVAPSLDVASIYGAVSAIEPSPFNGDSSHFVAGDFSKAGGVPAFHLARWSEDGWSRPIPIGGPYASAPKLCGYDDGSGPRLYVGSMIIIPGEMIPALASWDGQTWTPVGAGFPSGTPFDTITALERWNDGDGEVLLVSGAFQEVGGIAASNIAIWNGSWSPMGAGLPAPANCFEVFDDGTGPALYAGISFGGGDAALNLWRWDGTEWSNAGGANDSRSAALHTGFIRDLQAFDDGSGSKLYVAGEFDAIAGEAAHSLARFDGSNWETFGYVDKRANVLEVVPVDGVPTLFVGGRFTYLGGNLCRGIARWDGRSWLPLGEGVGIDSLNLSEVAVCMANPHGDGVLVAGSFGGAGSASAASIAIYGADGLPFIVTQPSDETVTPPGSASFLVAASASPAGGALEFTWRHDGVALADDARVTGSSGPILVIDDIVSEDAGGYDVVVTTDCGGVVSATAQLTIACAGDLDVDGSVDGSDLGILLGAWGAPRGPADLDHDGAVGSSDLAVLLSAWGGCG